jgi:putative PIN family toxin of toxin-antitoxin system
MRVVLDTNIYISALVFGGEPRKVLTYAEARRFTLFISPTIQTELERTLENKFGWSHGRVTGVLAKLRRFMKTVTPTTAFKLSDDPDDDKILECAHAAKADYIVSGDDHLLRLARFYDIPIITVKTFLEWRFPDKEE